VAGFSEKQSQEDRESIEKDLKSPLLNNIAICLVKEGRLERAISVLELIVETVDPTNFKAWTRLFEALVSLGKL